MWARSFGTPRTTKRAVRLDAGRPGKLSAGTEAAFIRKRRADVAAACSAATGSRDDHAADAGHEVGQA
eukprot:932954-Lingulodinium_polyedra.AAC.1